MVLDVHCQTEDTVCISIVECGNDAIVIHSDLWLRPQIYVAFDTAYAPEILAFQIGACAPTEDFQRQDVLARLQVFVDQELGRILGIFAIADFLAVYIYI